MKRINYFREFAKYASLNVLGMLGLSCYILADTFFVAKGLGANGLTALNLAIPIYSFIHGSGLMFGIGGAIKYAIAKGQDDMNTANRVFTHAVFLALFFAAVFFVLGLFCSGAIIQLLGADDVVFEMSKTYLQVILLFAPMFILNNVLLCFVRNDGAPQLAMLAMLGGSVSNIILDYVFIFPLGMGMFGAVLATGLAPVISILILSAFFLQKKNSFHLIRCKVSAGLSAGVLSRGVPSLITELSSGIVIIMFNAIILRLQGNVGVAAYGVIANLSLVVLSMYTGIAQGTQPLLSGYHGKGDRGAVQVLLRYALTAMALVSAVVYVTVFFGASHIAGLFNSEQNSLLQAMAVSGLKIYFAGCLFAGCNIILSIYFTATDYARPAHMISLLRGVFLVIPMAFFLSAVGGMTGVWYVFPATEVIVAGIGCLLYGRFRGSMNPEGGTR